MVKLRIDPDNISFRLDFYELGQLLKDGEIKQTTALPGGWLTYKVICLPPGSAPGFQADGAVYCLSLAQNVIEEHKAALPSLKGIVNDFGHRTTVTLEVSLKKKVKRSLSTGNGNMARP